MVKSIIIILSFSFLLLISGCKDIDFGQKALGYVEHDLEKDSNSLVDSDLKVRFDHAFQTGLEEVNFHNNQITEILNNFFSIWIKIKDQTKNKSPEKAAEIHLHYIRETLPVLIGAKIKLEIMEKRNKSLGALCSNDYIKEKGLNYLGYIAPLSSFTDMQRLANDFANHVKVGIILSNNPDGIATSMDESLSVGIGVAVATIVSIASHGLSSWAFGLITSGVASGIDGISREIVRNKIKHQKNLLREAINKSSSHVMPPEAVETLAYQYCSDTKGLWNNEINEWDKQVQEVQQIWNDAYVFLMNEVDNIHAVLKPIQIEKIFYSGLDIQKVDKINAMEINREIRLGTQSKWIKIASLFSKIKNTTTGCDNDLLAVEKLKDSIEIYKKEIKQHLGSNDQELKIYFEKDMKKVEGIQDKMSEIFQMVTARECPQGIN